MKATFGSRLKELRMERDLSMEELIDDINKRHPGIMVSKSVVSRYENNKAMPKKFMIVEALADYFGVTIGYLMGKTNNKYEDGAKYRLIPVVGTIAAGVPIFAHENIDGYEYVHDDSCASFCLRIKGDSMIGARILDGDIVYIRRQPDIESGEIAAVLVDNEATLKRVYKVNSSVILHSENPDYPDMVYSKKDMKNISILGKAIAFKSVVR